MDEIKYTDLIGLFVKAILGAIILYVLFYSRVSTFNYINDLYLFVDLLFNIVTANLIALFIVIIFMHFRGYKHSMVKRFFDPFNLLMLIVESCIMALIFIFTIVDFSNLEPWMFIIQFIIIRLIVKLISVIFSKGLETYLKQISETNIVSIFILFVLFLLILLKVTFV